MLWEVLVSKTHESNYTSEEVVWISTIKVPKSGLSKAEVIDYLPDVWKNGTNLTDEYKDSSLSIEGTLSGESWTVDTSVPTQVKITFFKNAGNPGLLGSPAEREITIKLTTKVNQAWLNDDLESKGWSEHQNIISINGIQATDTVRYTKPGFNKVGPSDNAAGPNFDYRLVLSGVNEDTITVYDEFDTKYFELISSEPGTGGQIPWNHLYIFGGNQYDQSYKQTAISVATTDGGVKFTAAVPKTDDGQYYDYYKITYTLKLKEGVDLKQLAVANGGEYVAKNTARYGEEKAEYSFKTTYEPLNKELINDGQIGGTNRDAEYKITYNPGCGRMFNGETRTLIDTLNHNLAIKASTISISAWDKNGNKLAADYIPYSIDYSGEDTLLKFEIPDETKVEITYTAKVMGNGTVQLKNTAKIGDYEESVGDWKTMGGSGEGEGSVISLEILKVDGYNHNKKLEGVKFKFYRADGMPVGKNGEHDLYYTTNANGIAVIDGDTVDENGVHPDLYFNVLYKLEEIEPLSDYNKLPDAYEYTFTNDASSVNHQGPDYIYYFNDTTHIENWPLEGLIVKKQVTNEADNDKVFNFKITAWDDKNVLLNGKNGDDTFVNGVVTFTLKAGQQKQFWGFKKGYTYKVEEILTDEEGQIYTTSVRHELFDIDNDGNVTNRRMSDPAEGTSYEGELTSGTYEHVEFTNERPLVGSLKLKKLVSLNDKTTNGTLVDGEYTFTIVGPTLSDVDQVTKTVTIKVENGSANGYKIDGAGAFTNVPSDGFVEVTELQPGPYTITETNSTNSFATLKKAEGGQSVTDKVVTVMVEADKTGSAVPATAIATFTNNIDTYSLNVTKVVAGDTAPTDDSTYDVKVTSTVPMNITIATDVVGDGLVGTPALSEDKLTITFQVKAKPGTPGVVTINKLVAGTYTVEETIAQNALYVATYKIGEESGQSVTLSDAAKSGAATITNTYSASVSKHLEVKKVVKDGSTNVTPIPNIFKFKLEAVSPANAPLPNVTEVANSGENVTFGDMTFKAAGTYSYKITETGFAETVTEDQQKTYSLSTETEIYAKIEVTKSATENKYVATEPAYFSDAACKTAVADPKIENKKVKKPDFEKKIQDTNDSTGETSDWQDSADYDIGDNVPYRLTATLASNVTDYRKYFIIFHDTMEPSLDFSGVSNVTVNGTEVTDYELTPGDHNFDLKLTWDNGDEKIADEKLNSGTVEVLFSAKLNENARLGKPGNVNTCLLEYSNNPNVTDEGKLSEETDKTPEDSVIAFTYKVDISKVDPNGKALTGAEFTLEKVVADGTEVISTYEAVTDKNVFSFKGLDDGEYVLTETKAPANCLKVDPIRFTVTADHNVVWDIKSADDVAGTRESVLTALSGDCATGELTFTADAQMEGLTSDLENTPTTEVSVTKKLHAADGSEEVLANAKLKVVRVEDGKEVDIESWTSGDAAHKVVDKTTGDESNTNLKPGTYILYETAVPNVEYFVQADPITFVVTADGEITINGEIVNSITMLDLLTETGENWYESEKNKGKTTPDEDEEQEEEDNKKEKQKKKKKSTTITKKKTQKTTTKKSKGAKTADPSNAALPLAGCAAALAAVLYLFFDKRRRRG